METIRAWEIDPATGLFVGDLPHHPAGEIGPHIVTAPCPDGFIRPRWDGGQWVEGGQRDPEQALAAIRAERTRRLAGSDWTQLPDAPFTPEQAAAWQAYRQALRDFPASCDPLAPEWPAEPTTE